MTCLVQGSQTLGSRLSERTIISHVGYLQDAPASLDTNTLSVPFETTPTKILGVADPEVPDVESNVTQATPILSLLYPDVSVGSGMYVPRHIG